MIKRYKTKQMLNIWNEQSKIDRWTDIEKAAVEGLFYLKVTSAKIYKEIQNTKSPTVKSVLEYEKITNHDLVAFIKAFTENMSEEAQQIVHLGLTSSDIVDTGFSIAIVKSLNILLEDLEVLYKTLGLKAKDYKDVACVGRTHGVHAEITSFGLKFLGWQQECNRNINRVYEALDQISFGKLSGAIGTYSQVTPERELHSLRKLNLFREPVATQIIPRDRHAHVLSTIALVSNMIERIAFEIRSLQRTEIGEASEGFMKNQVGSSAMPHKKNPILSERLTGLSRLIRGYMITAFENTALWHERDISHSSTERVIFPDAFHIIHYMIKNTKSLIKNLVIDESAIRKNISLTDGKIFSQNILTWLIKKGMTRNEAYDIVKKASTKTFRGSLIQLLPLKIKQDFIKDINKIFGYSNYLENINYIYNKVKD